MRMHRKRKTKVGWQPWFLGVYTGTSTVMDVADCAMSLANRSGTSNHASIVPADTRVMIGSPKCTRRAGGNRHLGVMI
jgi:hypothetical protein